MATNFPTSLDSLTNPLSTDTQSAVSHSSQHANTNDAIEAIQAKLGINSSAVTTSHDYKLSGVATGDKAVSKTGTETLTNKTLTSPVINVGSDSTGDIYYRSAGGVFTRLAVGSTDQILSVAAGLPVWVANPSGTDTSYSTKGIVRLNTDAATSGISVASGVITVNYGTSANQIVKLDSSAKLPAVDGTQLTGIRVWKTGVTTRDASTASGAQTIAHGLASIPKGIEIHASFGSGASSIGNLAFSDGEYNGTQTSCVFGIVATQNSANNGAVAGNSSTNIITMYFATDGATTQVATATFDATNITLNWTKAGSPTGTINIRWRAWI